jgi:hypothetical protein
MFSGLAETPLFVELDVLPLRREESVLSVEASSATPPHIHGLCLLPCPSHVSSFFIFLFLFFFEKQPGQKQHINATTTTVAELDTVVATATSVTGNRDPSSVRISLQMGLPALLSAVEDAGAFLNAENVAPGASVSSASSYGRASKHTT